MEAARADEPMCFCLQPLRGPGQVLALPCGHSFHQECLQRSFEGDRHASRCADWESFRCPTYRAPIGGGHQ
eukprot:3749114-Alexandrium_andersonii.AAC.1